MNWTNDRDILLENYQKLKVNNTSITLSDCMSIDMKSNIEFDKMNIIKSSKQNQEYKKFCYETLIENKELSSLAEFEFEFRCPNYILHYDFEYAEIKLQVAIVNFLNEKLSTFFEDFIFSKVISLDDLCIDDTRIVIYQDHTEVLIISDAFDISIRLIIKENESCILEY